ncbi:MAG TPA: hypothetical protein VNE38_06465 [Ktedonobacteraceae bacterium]|nr:hypothetical protein [Ktedonobacteraceae bacterium]
MKSPNTNQQQYSSYAYENSQMPSEDFKGRRARPKRLDIFFHLTKTFKLIGALMVDRRIPLWRKALFFGSIGGLLVILLFPDILGEFVMSTVLPLAGTVIGVPVDAGFDWLAFALALVSLLRFFPAELVAEHYRQVFQKRF